MRENLRSQVRAMCVHHRHHHDDASGPSWEGQPPAKAVFPVLVFRAVGPQPPLVPCKTCFKSLVPNALSTQAIGHVSMSLVFSLIPVQERQSDGGEITHSRKSLDQRSASNALSSNRGSLILINLESITNSSALYVADESNHTSCSPIP
jgi:hypothetical protein